MLDNFIKLVIGDLNEKREYKKIMKRVNALPKDYSFAFKKYKSISDAANELGISREKISMSIFHKTKLLNSFFIKADMDVSIILNKYK